MLLRILGLKDSPTKIEKALNDGGQLLDVRTQREFQNGHGKNSINIPLEELGARIKELKIEHTYIVFCQSGARSAVAKKMLKKRGYSVINGGSWMKYM